VSHVPSDGRYNVWAGNPSGNPRDEKRCWEQVHEGGRGGLFYQCRSKWKVERNGTPEKVAVRHAKREERYRAARDASDRKWARISAEADLIAAALTWYHGGEPGQDRDVALAAAVEALIPLRGKP
jgi:hypothetical protein